MLVGTQASDPPPSPDPLHQSYIDINKDLHRTFPRHASFYIEKESAPPTPSFKALKRILHAFVRHGSMGGDSTGSRPGGGLPCYDRYIGYFQGMNQLAGMIVLLAEIEALPEALPEAAGTGALPDETPCRATYDETREERCFWLFSRLIRGLLPPAFLGERADLGLAPCQGMHKALESVSGIVTRRHPGFLSQLAEWGLSVDTDVVLPWLPNLFIGDNRAIYRR